MEFREICLLNDSFPPLIDGVSNAVENYAAEILKSGHPVSVVTPDCPGADDSGYPYPVIRYAGIDTREKIDYMIGNPFPFSAEAQLARRPISLLHTHSPAISEIVARTMRAVLHVPMVLTYHTRFDIDIQNSIHNAPVRALANRTLMNQLNACDELWVVSRGAGESIRALGYEKDFVVMENGVDIPLGRLPENEVLERTKGHDLPTDVPVFLFVGRLKWYKGARLILDALARLNVKGKDFRMVFIGRGVDEAEIRAYAETSGLNGKILFIGTVSDRQTLKAWYCRADLFLFPSTFDTNGLVVREAAACGLGSVLIKGSSAAEDITDSRSGFLIREDAAEFADLLARVMDNKQVLRTVGENAAAELYISWHDAARKALDRYGTVLDRYYSGRIHKRKG